MAFRMSEQALERFGDESAEASAEEWLANAARWPCPWIWHDLDGPWLIFTV
jgi:hypothetical protein